VHRKLYYFSEEERMSKEKRFSIGIGGYEFYADRFDDMPEAVRAYLDALGDQLGENDIDVRVELPDVCVPKEADEYFQRKLQERLEAAAEDVNTVKVDEYPAENLEKLLDGHIDTEIAKSVNRAQTEADMGEVALVGFYLNGLYRILFHEDRDWSVLGVKDAVRLYCGIAAGMLAMASQYSKIVEEEDEEEADSDDEDAE
jgi:hypothetical protein